jgi:Asp-tRNA(Asn)/Glu-tRNA(Gln) amidotransferase B subunit
VEAELPEMPWDTVKRLTEHYGVAGRDVETLLGLDEFDGQGVEYFENVTGGEAKLGKRAINWYVQLECIGADDQDRT